MKFALVNNERQEAQPGIIGNCICCGRLRSFSLERLIRFLNELGQDVSIMISPAKSQLERGHTWISE